MELIYSFTVALFLTIALIPLLIRFSAQLNLVDAPGDERKMHDTVMPRSGGLAIILGVFLPLGFLMSLDGYIPYLFAGCWIIVVFGLWDDKTELSYQWKLLGQALAVVVVMSGGIVIHQIPFMGVEDAPTWFSYPLTFVFLLGVINGVNFSDGLDGLAAGTSLLALAAIAVLASITDNHGVALIAITVIGAVLGFLRYNTFPARIFMGDAGSQFLGFITACLAIVVTQAETSALNTFLPVLLLGLPILDIIQVVPVRIKKKLPLPGPDKEHFHHQLVKLGFRHHEVVALIYILQLIMMSGAYFLRFENDLSLAVFFAGYLAVVLGAIYSANLAGWQLRAVVPSTGERARDRRNSLLRRLSWIHYYSVPVVTVLLLLFFIITPLLITVIGSQLSMTALVLATVFAVGLLRSVNSPLIARIACYSASVFLVYLMAVSTLPDIYSLMLDGFLGFLAMFLMLSIRMTRKEQFRLDAQDLLILLMVIIVPQIPLDIVGDLSVGAIALRLAVLMYTCEFLLAREEQGHFKYISIGSVVSLMIVGLVAS